MTDPRFALPGPRWRVRVADDRSRWKAMSAQILAQVDVYAPTGDLYLVKIVRDQPMRGTDDLMTGGLDPVSLARYIQKNLSTERGWEVRVETPTTALRSSRTRFSQPVGAAAIVVDVAMAIVDAIARGDDLWHEE